MKKALTLVSVLLMMAMVFSLSVLAADETTEITQADTLPKSGDLSLTADVDASTTFTISIPSGTKEVILDTAAQSVGEVKCTAFDSNVPGKKVSVLATKKTDLTNTGGHSIPFTINPSTAIEYTAENHSAVTDVKITLDSGAVANLISGIYTGAMTFTVSTN